MIKKTLLLPLAILAAALPAHALDTLSIGHADVGIAFDLGAFDLHVHDEENDVEYAPNAVLLQVNPQAYELIPNNPNFAFLGTVGVDYIWRLPAVENVDLLYLGIGSEEITSGTLDGDVFTFSLISVTGPGNFTLYQDGVTPTVIFNSGNGITGADSVTLPTGGHAHYNWTFSEAGTYEIAFKADGLDGGVPVTETATYTFTVVPEPSTAIFGAIGVAALAFRRQRRAQLA